MFKLTDNEMYLVGLLLEGFLYGLYSGIFAIYLQHEALKKDTDRTQHIIFYAMCTLYFLSVVVFACDIVGSSKNSRDSLLPIFLTQTTTFGCCDFIAQFILIYRCWIVWGHNIRVVIIPSVLSFGFLATWISCGSSALLHVIPGWVPSVLFTTLALSLTVNALVMGLIVFRIFKVFQEIESTSDDQFLGTTGGTKLRRIILILIESGMALFSIQFARLLVSILKTGTGASYIIVTIHQMVNGITPTIILVRTSMGLSIHDEKSMEEGAIGSLHFASDHPDSVPETGSISINIVSRDSRDDDDIDIRQSNDIDVVER